MVRLRTNGFAFKPYRWVPVRLTRYLDAIGNAGVARTAVGELAHNAKLDQAKAFSLFGFCSAFGYVIGPLLGGLLSNPAEKFSWKSPGGVFVEYPYLLPCIVSSSYNIVVCVLSWWSLEETNQRLRGFEPVTKRAPESDLVDPETATEREPLLGPSESEQSDIHSRKATVCCIVGIA